MNEMPERIWVERDDETDAKRWYSIKGMGVEYIRADLATLSSEQARDALTELDQLRDRVKELEKALEPFAKAAEIKLCGEWRDDERFAQTDVGFHLTFGHLRTARRILSALEP